MSCMSISSISSVFPHARVAPASLQTVIREAHTSLKLQQRIDILTRRLHDQLKKLRQQVKFPPPTTIHDIYATQDAAKKTEIDIATTKAHTMQVRPSWLSQDEIAMITPISLLHLTKGDIALIPELVSIDNWEMIQGLLKKIE